MTLQLLHIACLPSPPRPAAHPRTGASAPDWIAARRIAACRHRGAAPCRPRWQRHRLLDLEQNQCPRSGTAAAAAGGCHHRRTLSGGGGGDRQHPLSLHGGVQPRSSRQHTHLHSDTHTDTLTPGLDPMRRGRLAVWANPAHRAGRRGERHQGIHHLHRALGPGWLALEPAMPGPLQPLTLTAP